VSPLYACDTVDFVKPLSMAIFRKFMRAEACGSGMVIRYNSQAKLSSQHDFARSCEYLFNFEALIFL
jgi:hypothetical protein